MNRRYSTREKYENEMKTYAIEVENPVFPLGRFVMPISENKYKVMFLCLQLTSYIYISYS